MSLKEAVAQAQKSRTSSSNTEKNPSHYAKQLRLGIAEACESPVSEVRIHHAGSEFTPVSNLKTMLEREEEKDVLSVLLMNDRIPAKSLQEFLTTPRMELFEETDEAYQYVVARLEVPSDNSDDEE